MMSNIIEVKNIKTVFGDHAKKLAVSSTKSMTGHMLGASGSSETIFSILALKHQVIPPTINLDEPDPQCDLDYTPHEARNKKMEYALSNSFGFLINPYLSIHMPCLERYILPCKVINNIIEILARQSGITMAFPYQPYILAPLLWQ